MASANAFSQLAPTILVGTSAVQIATNQRTSNGYRVRCVVASGSAYFTTGQTSSVTSVGAPTTGVPSAATMGMGAGTVETFTNLGDWMIASAAGAFEVTPGDGV